MSYWRDAVRFSPDSKCVALLTTHTIHVWDVKARCERFPHDSVFMRAISPDGKALFLSHERDHAVRDVATGKTLTSFDRSAYWSPGRCSFSPDGRHVAMPLALGVTHVWPKESYERRTRLPQLLRPWPLYATDDEGRVYATSNFNGTVGLGILDTHLVSPLGTYELVGHVGPLVGMRFDPNIDWLATVGSDRTLRVWNLKESKGEAGAVAVRVDAKDELQRPLAWSRDATMLAYVEGKRLRVIRASGDPVGDWPLAGPIRCVEFFPDDERLAYGDEQGILRVLHRPSGKIEREVEAHRKAVAFLRLFPDGKSLLSGGEDGEVSRWDAASFAPRGSVPGSTTISTLCIGGDGRSAAAGDVRGNVFIWDIARRRERRWNSGPYGTAIGALGISRDGKRLGALLASMTRAHIDPTTGEEAGGKVGLDACEPDAVASSPDSRTVVTATPSALRLWDLASKTCLADRAVQGRYERAVAFSPDGSRIAAAGRGIFIWNRGKPGTDVEIAESETGQVTSLAFHPDGRLLASRGSQIQLWDAEDGHLLQSFAEVASRRGGGDLAFFDDGRLLLSGQWGETRFELVVWEVASGQKGFHLQQLPDGFQRFWLLADEKTLMTSHAQGNALAWNLADLLERHLNHELEKLPRDLAALWTQLAARDPIVAQRALRAMLQQPEKTTAFLVDAVKPVARTDRADERVRALIADLGSTDEDARRRASSALRSLGSAAFPEIRRALEAKPAQNVAERLRLLLAARRAPATDNEVRDLRAVQLLEKLGTKAAHQHLQRLATGSKHARLTQEARSALDRRQERSPQGLP
jgi:WD40 repeat protein